MKIYHVMPWKAVAPRMNFTGVGHEQMNVGNK